MQTSDFLALTADTPQTAIILTEADMARPGPAIVHVNEAFLELTGHARETVIGRTPRLLQGTETSRLSVLNIGRALRRCEPVVECLINYRADGSPYICSLEIHPLYGSTGRLEHFVAFEREVVRRRGRPRSGYAGRFAPILPEARLPHEMTKALAA